MTKITASLGPSTLASTRLPAGPKNGIESGVKFALFWTTHDHASQTIEPETLSPLQLVHGLKFGHLGDARRAPWRAVLVLRRKSFCFARQDHGEIDRLAARKGL